MASVEGILSSLGLSPTDDINTIIQKLKDYNLMTTDEIHNIQNISVKPLPNIVRNQADILKQRMYGIATDEDYGLPVVINRRMVLVRYILNKLFDQTVNLEREDSLINTKSDKSNTVTTDTEQNINAKKSFDREVTFNNSSLFSKPLILNGDKNNGDTTNSRILPEINNTGVVGAPKTHFNAGYINQIMTNQLFPIAKDAENKGTGLGQIGSAENRWLSANVDNVTSKNITSSDSIKLGEQNVATELFANTKVNTLKDNIESGDVKANKAINDEDGSSIKGTYETKTKVNEIKQTLSGDIATAKTESKTYTDTKISELYALILGEGSQDAYDTFKEVADYIASDKSGATAMLNSINQNAAAIETLRSDMDTEVYNLQQNINTKANKDEVFTKLESENNLKNALASINVNGVENYYSTDIEVIDAGLTYSKGDLYIKQINDTLWIIDDGTYNITSQWVEKSNHTVLQFKLPRALNEKIKTLNGDYTSTGTVAYEPALAYENTTYTTFNCQCYLKRSAIDTETGEGTFQIVYTGLNSIKAGSGVTSFHLKMPLILTSGALTLVNLAEVYTKGESDIKFTEVYQAIDDVQTGSSGALNNYYTKTESDGKYIHEKDGKLNIESYNIGISGNKIDMSVDEEFLFTGWLTTKFNIQDTFYMYYNKTKPAIAYEPMNGILKFSDKITINDDYNQTHLRKTTSIKALNNSGIYDSEEYIPDNAYSTGSSGQVLKSNGVNCYWGTIDVPNDYTIRRRFKGANTLTSYNLNIGAYDTYNPFKLKIIQLSEPSSNSSITLSIGNKTIELCSSTKFVPEINIKVIYYGYGRAILIEPFYTINKSGREASLSNISNVDFFTITDDDYDATFSLVTSANSMCVVEVTKGN